MPCLTAEITDHPSSRRPLATLSRPPTSSEELAISLHSVQTPICFNSTTASRSLLQSDEIHIVRPRDQGHACVCVCVIPSATIRTPPKFPTMSSPNQADANSAKSVSSSSPTSDSQQKPKRARTSKPKVKTGCNNCKYVANRRHSFPRRTASNFHPQTTAHQVRREEAFLFPVCSLQEDLHGLPTAESQRKTSRSSRHCAKTSFGCCPEWRASHPLINRTTASESPEVASTTHNAPSNTRLQRLCYTLPPSGQSPAFSTGGTLFPTLPLTYSE